MVTAACRGRVLFVDKNMYIIIYSRVVRTDVYLFRLSIVTCDQSPRNRIRRRYTMMNIKNQVCSFVHVRVWRVHVRVDGVFERGGSPPPIAFLNGVYRKIS